ncbi:MAG: hypothetical protein WBB42_01955 [Polyangiales bacterium]
MRYLLHIGLFALALTAVTQADAQNRRHANRQTTVVIAPRGGPYAVQPVRASFDPPRAVYDQRRTIHHIPKTTHLARRAYFDEREDLEQIVRISERWERATAERNSDAQWKVNRRLDAWLEREIRESPHDPRNQRYTQRVRLLRYELVSLERSRNRGYVHNGRGHNGRGHNARSHGGYFTKKASILNELVRLSERQVQLAEARLHAPYRLSVAYR